MPEESTPAPGNRPGNLPSNPPRDPPPDSGLQDVMNGITGLHRRIYELEKALVNSGGGIAPDLKTLGPELRRTLVPAWRRDTPGEPRWHVALAVTAAIFLQWPLPGRLVLFQPGWLLPVMETVLLVILVILDRSRIDRESMVLRGLGLAAATILSVANAWSAVRLVMELVNGTIGNSAGPLLASGAVIWLTNVIVFAVWYWELDRGGPAARAHGTHECPDFMFPQMTSPDMAPKDWEPSFPDYAYVAFTNATAFSPTDTMPMTRWAKAAMTLQSMVSIAVVALVVARAVNILR
jgi:uncharacterized membrane protein